MNSAFFSHSLKVDHLTLAKGYNLLIDRLSFEVQSGEALSIFGANGVGKTTLLRALAGFIAPNLGKISYFSDRFKLPKADFGQYIHYLGHLDSLSPVRRVAQEITFMRDFLGADAQTDAIDQLELRPLLDLQTRFLSAGQKRRVSWYRLIACHRPVWLLDEPLSPMDQDRRALFTRLMQAHLSMGGMIIAAVHDALPIDTKSLLLTRPSLEAQEGFFHV